MKKAKMGLRAVLGKALGLAPVDGAEIDCAANSTPKLRKLFGRSDLLMRRLAGTSRTRVMAILNRNTQNVSTDLLLRVLYALGYTAKITFQKAA
jgi:hypothetical protein